MNVLSLFRPATPRGANGVKELINGWKIAAIPDWELHITGFGRMTEELRNMAATAPSVTFHGMIRREELVRLLCSARICINPHVVSQTPGNVFAFKIIEYLAAGAHVITTRMGSLEPDLESGITYMPNNKAETIAATLRKVIGNHRYERTAVQATLQTYGPEAVASSLQNILNRAMSHRRERRDCVQETLQLGSSGPRTRPKI